MRTAFTAPTALTASATLHNAVLLVHDGHVEALFSRSDRELPTGVREHALPGETILVPAFCDVHIHGSAGHDVMQRDSAGQARLARFLAQHGTSEFLATTVTASVEDTLEALDAIAAWIEKPPEGPGSQAAARPVGIHLEGPFVSHKRRGVHPPEFIQPPSVALFTRFYQAARGHIRLLTLAPELEGAPELLAHAVALGVRVSLGHSDATYAEATRAIAGGAASATHTYNAMRPLEHREPGLTSAALTCDELFAELIADGHHVSAPAMQVWARSKPAGRRILVTDAIAATGQPDGEYRLGSIPVTVRDGRAEYDGKLAGSVLTLDRGVEIFAQATGTSAAEAAVAATLNPRAMLGLPRPLAPGSPADFLALMPDGSIAATWIRGEIAQE